MKIIGRKNEQLELMRYFNSGKPEFIAVTGRRRIGKTFLIRELFAENIAFYFSGSINKNVTNVYQLQQFDLTILECGGESKENSKSWAEAFWKLRHLLKDKDDGRKIIFIDELPWLDAPKSDFLAALDYFWNTFASSRSDIMLIVSGSSTSWIIENIFQNKGGLHNRITGRISLAPFTLVESEEFFFENGIVMNRYQIAESLMIFGGVPYYLNMFDKGLSLTLNVDRLLFSENAPLKNEFNEVYRSLFKKADRHIDIVRALSETKSGMTRNEIIKKTGIPGGGNLTKNLNELEQCGFIEKYFDFTRPKNNSYYRLIDPFTLYWLKYVEKNNFKDEFFWTNLLDDGGRRAWSGNAFEMLCLNHISEIRKKLGISGVSTQVFTWRNTEAQIDLVISRRDGVINLCEMKYSIHPITLTVKDSNDLERKRNVFIENTRTRKAVHITMVTTYGLTNNSYRAQIQSVVSLDDLFN